MEKLRSTASALGRLHILPITVPCLKPRFDKLQDLDILFLDALRHKPHPTHSTVENSLRIVERVKPRRAFFTHICHDLPHAETNASLPPHVRLSYDGMKLEFEI